MPGRPSVKIFILFGIAVIQTFISFFLIYKISPEVGLIISSIIYGLSNSVLFPLLLLIPGEMGMQASPSQNSNFLLFSFLGEGTLSVFAGYLMKLVSNDCLFYWMGFINLLGFFMHFYALQKLQK